MTGSLQGPAGRLKTRSDPWRYHLTRVLLSLFTFAGVMLLFPGNDSRSILRMRVGQISPRRVVAPFSFRIYKSDARLLQERQTAMNAIPPVVERDSAASAAALAELAAYATQVHALERHGGSPEMRAAELARLGPTLSESTREVLGVPRLSGAVLEVARKSLGESYERGVLSRTDYSEIRRATDVALRAGPYERRVPAQGFSDPDGAAAAAAAAGQQVWGEGSAAAEAVADVARFFAHPNTSLNRRELEFRRSLARESVSMFSGSVLQDEMIVDAHERVTEDISQKLRSLDAAVERQQGEGTPAVTGVWTRLGRALATLILVLVFVLYLKLYRPTIYNDTSLLVLLGALTLFILCMAALSVRVFFISEYLIPVALLPILVTVLFEHQLALFAGLLLCVLVASVADLGLNFVAVSAVGVLAAVASMANLRRRADFYRAMGWISLASAASIAALGMGTATSSEALMRDVLWGVVNGVLSTLLAIGMLPLLEHIFNVSTDITLIELTDLNRPLLQRLLLEAPGTHHHSVVVGQLADAACKAIGAKALQARVGALYHDIGKIPRSEYFRENQGTARSPHDKLAPTMSALILGSHVKEGLEMAKKAKLPRALWPFIAEHHGTGLMAFFYHKSLELDPRTDQTNFRYPGPRPQSKETAVVMLADGVEAASRSLVEPTPSRIRGVVMRILDERAREGQLDDCGLTFKELAQIREAFIPILAAVHHARVIYPTLAEPRRPGSDAHRDRESLPRDQA